MVQRWFNYLTKALRAMSRRGALFLLAGVIITSSLVVAAVPTKSVSAQSVFGIAASNNCNIAGIGWVLCPTMRSIAQIADKSFAFIDKDFLNLKFGRTSTDSKTLEAWQFMQGFANVSLVAVFLYIIYNYLVGRTGGAYSLKRQLPRMLIIVILIQASYYIGVVFVELSNIIGDSIWGIMKGVVGSSPTGLPLDQVGGLFASDGRLTEATMNVLAGQTPWALIPLVAVSTISIALVSSATIVLVFMREAVVATLIIASPLLIVFYLLPNLERLSSQAMRLFFQLLVLYPIIALLLGAGQIISIGAMSSSVFVAASIAVLPLLATWFLFKNISTAMDMAGARMSASVSSRRGGQDDKEARVTGRATAGASAMKNALGLNPNGSSRKQSFSRNRRRASLAETTLIANGSGGGSKKATRQGGSQLATDVITENVAILGGSKDAGTAADSSLMGGAAIDNSMSSSEDYQSSTLNQNSALNQSSVLNKSTSLEVNQQEGLGGKVMTAVLGAKGREKDQDKKSVTAKDIFSSLNRGMGHQSKDKQLSFSSGPGQASAPPSSGSSQSGTPTMGPVTNYAATSMAQGANIVSGSSVGAQPPVQAVAVPVMVDASSLLQNKTTPQMGNPLSPVVGTQKDAEARANKYLFDAQRDINEARDAEDILGHKRDENFEPPHINTGPAKPQDQDDKK